MYILPGHSLLNRKSKPFILCECKRGEGVKDENHECEIISDKRQKGYWGCSKRGWNNHHNKDEDNDSKIIIEGGQIKLMRA